MAKITKRTVDALEPRDREHVLWDDEIKGFGVRVRPSGRKTYIVKYRDRGRAVKITIGPHGAISPAAARARAAEIVTAARTGKDLSGRDLRDAKAPTVAELGRRFLDEYVTDHCKPNTKRQYRKMVRNRSRFFSLYLCTKRHGLPPSLRRPQAGCASGVLSAE